MPQAFSELFRQHLAAQGLTQKAFADLVGRSHSYVSKVAKDRRGPPDDLEAWADALHLRGADRDAFLEAGYLALTPEFIRDRYVKLRDKA